MPIPRPSLPTLERCNWATASSLWHRFPSTPLFNAGVVGIDQPAGQFVT